MSKPAKSVELDSPVFVAGHRGMVGSSICRKLTADGYTNILTATRDELDLRDQLAVNNWFAANRPKYVYLVAGTVGGILANSTRQAEFLYDNMMIHTLVIEASRRFAVSKLLYLGSACVYPRLSQQPIEESALMTGPLEPTNEGYALAKVAGMRLCDFYRQQYGCNFISAMPTNIYGPNDNFDLESSHVLPAIMRKVHEANFNNEATVEIWGTGNARREFLHVDDLADACLFLMDTYDGVGHINVGTGIDISIGDLASKLRDTIYPGCDLVFDPSKPDGMPRRVLDTSMLTNLGWRPTIDLISGIASTYEWYQNAYLDVTSASDIDVSARTETISLSEPKVSP